MRASVSVPNTGATTAVSASCTAGQVAISGGAGWDGGAGAGEYIADDGPVNSTGNFSTTTTGTTPVLWYAEFVNFGAASDTAYVWVICA